MANHEAAVLAATEATRAATMRDINARLQAMQRGAL